jgi:hypothetical protein
MLELPVKMMRMRGGGSDRSAVSNAWISDSIEMDPPALERARGSDERKQGDNDDSTR